MTEMNATCETCHTTVNPREGVLWVDLADLPDPDDHVSPLASWKVTHVSCYPADAMAYSLDLEQVMDPFRFLGWCAHLSEKTWLSRTNWRSFLRRVSEQRRFGAPTVPLYAEKWDG